MNAPRRTTTSRATSARVVRAPLDLSIARAMIHRALYCAGVEALAAAAPEPFRPPSLPRAGELFALDAMSISGPWILYCDRMEDVASDTHLMGADVCAFSYVFGQHAFHGARLEGRSITTLIAHATPPEPPCSLDLSGIVHELILCGMRSEWLDSQPRRARLLAALCKGTD